MSIREIISDEVREDREKALKAIKDLDTQAVEILPVLGELEAREAAANRKSEHADLLVLLSRDGSRAASSAKSCAAAVAVWSLLTCYSLSTCVNAIGTMRRQGKKAKMIYSWADDPDIGRKVCLMARVGHTFRR